MENNTPPQSVISSEVEIPRHDQKLRLHPRRCKLDGEINSCTGDAIIGKSAQIKRQYCGHFRDIEGACRARHCQGPHRDEIPPLAYGRHPRQTPSVEDGVTFIGRSEVNPSGSPVQRGARR